MTSVTGQTARAHLVIPVLGLVQILNWGATFFLPAVLGRAIVADTAWNYAIVVGGLSIGLGVAGVVSKPVGRAIETHGGRPVLAASSGFIAVGLAALGCAQSEWVYLVGWIVIGLGMGGGLYDAAFSTLGRLYGQEARRAISTLTLYSGFASTIAWPLSAFLVDHVGWRGACLTYAALELLLCLPLVLMCITDAPAASSPLCVASVGIEPPPLRRRRATLLLLAAILTSGGLINAVVSVHLITFLQVAGLTYAAAVGLGTLIGPAQVLTRLIERLFGKAMHPIWTILLAIASMAVGLVLLCFGATFASIAIIFYGAGAGIWSIGRGTLPLALFGSRGYPELMGFLATPALIAQALAPSLGAVLVDWAGVGWTEALLAGLTVLSTAAVVALYGLARDAIAPVAR